MKNYTKYWQHMVTILVIGELMLFPITVFASEPVVYEQSPGHFGGFSSDGVVFTVADEFQLDESTLISNITWWGGYLDPTPLPDDNFTIQLFEENNGQPGALLQTFTVGNTAMRTATGDWINPPAPEAGFEGSPEFEYSFDLPAVFSAEAGTRYWLAIINTPSSDSWVWEVSGSLANPGVQRSFEGGPWEAYYDNTAFQLQTAVVPVEGYEQLPGHFGGFSSDGVVFTVADEFQFDEATVIGNITWWGGYGGSASSVDNFTIQLFADNSGQPGALLQTFMVGNAAVRTATGDWINPPVPEAGFEGSPEFEYSFDLPAVFSAESGTHYWLSITNMPDTDNWIWEVSGSLVNLGVQRSFENGPWEQYFDNTAFRLKVAEEFPSLTVGIDIKPGSRYNRIRLNSRGFIPVVIFSSSTFDAPGQVDRISLTFGRTGDEQSLAGWPCYQRDMNRDGLQDLMCYFRTQAAGFQIGDTTAILKGSTLTGSPFSGSDSVWIVP